MLIFAEPLLNCIAQSRDWKLLLIYELTLDRLTQHNEIIHTHFAGPRTGNINNSHVQASCQSNAMPIKLFDSPPT